jgi:hypothetical protein
MLEAPAYIWFSRHVTALVFSAALPGQYQILAFCSVGQNLAFMVGLKASLPTATGDKPPWPLVGPRPSG